MNNKAKPKRASLLFLPLFLLLNSCGPSVQLTASWSDNNIQPVNFSKILVLAIGKDLEKRKLGEDHIKAELQNRGFSAKASLDEFGPDFASQFDSTRMRQLLLDKQFDGVITIRVLAIVSQRMTQPDARRLIEGEATRLGVGCRALDHLAFSRGT